MSKLRKAIHITSGILGAVCVSVGVGLLALAVVL